MPTRDELTAALRRADAAGAADDARRLAAAIQRMDAGQTKPEQGSLKPFAAPAQSSYEQLAATPQRSVVGAAPQWASESPLINTRSIQDEGRAALQSASDKLRVKSPGGAQTWSASAEPDLVGGVGDLLKTANYGVRDWWRHMDDKSKGDAAAQIVMEATGAPAIARFMDHAGQKTGNEFLKDQTGLFQTDENYNPEQELALYGINAGSWSARNKLADLINPRKVDGSFVGPQLPAMAQALAKPRLSEFVAPAADVATNLTMGGSDLLAAGAKGVVKGASGIADMIRGGERMAEAPEAPQSSAVFGPQQPPSAAQSRQLQPATPPPGNLQPVSRPQAGPVTTEYRNLHPKVQAAFTRLMENSGVEPERIPAMLANLDALPTERSSMIATELIKRFGGGDPKLQTNIEKVGRDFTVNTPTGKGDDAQAVVRDSIRRALDEERPFLEGVAERKFGPGAAATKEAIEADVNKTRAEYRRILDPKKPYGRITAPKKRAQIDAARQELATYLRAPDVANTIPQWVRQDAINTLNRDLRAMGQPPIQKSGMTDFEWAEIVDAYPTQIAHSLQSSYATAAREAGKSLDMQGGAMARDLAEKRGRSRIRANAANPDDRGYGLLYMLEQAVPEYRDTRIKFGHEMGARDALTLPERFLSIADDEVKLSQFLDDLDELTPAQYDAAKNQITSIVRNAMNKKIEEPSLAEVGAGERGVSIPNLTALSKRGVLDALEKAFGDDGKQLADAIRLSRANTKTLTNIEPDFGPRSASNLKDAEGAPKLYEDPKSTNQNVIDNTAALMGSIGVGTALTGNLPAALGIMSLAAAKAAWNAIKNGKKLSPEQRTQFARFLFELRRGAPDEAPRLRGPDAPVLPSPDDALASPPSSPPVRAGFFGGSQTNMPPELGGAMIGGTVGYMAAPEDQKGAGAVLGALGGVGLGRLARGRGNSAMKDALRQELRVTKEVLSSTWADLSTTRNPEIANRIRRSIKEGEAKVAALEDAIKAGSDARHLLTPREDIGDLINDAQNIIDGRPTAQRATLKHDQAQYIRDREAGRITFNGFGGSKPPLDMSEAARMQRAIEQGFDVETPLYHGSMSSSAFDEFDVAKAGRGQGSKREKAIWFSPDKTVASAFSYKDPIPVYVRGKLKEVDVNREAHYNIDIAKILEDARKEGYAGVRIKNMYEGVKPDWAPPGHDPISGKRYVDQVAIFDPANIRRTDAAFDPSQSGSSKLLAGMGGIPEGVGAAGGATYGYIANPTDANGDGVIDDQDRGLNAMGGLVSGGILAHGGRRAVGAVGNALKGGVAPRALEPLELSKANRVYAPGKPDDLGFITSAEYVLANPPARFRDAKALTADQWRKLMREGGASGESFKWQIEPALKRLADEGVTGDIPKARFEEALARTRGTLDRVGIRQLGDIGFESQRMRETRIADDIGIAIGQNRTREVERLRAKQQEMQQSYEAKYDEYVAPGKSSNYQQHVLTLPESQGQGYKSHNWNTKNPVGHVRTTNRTSANGEKVLHVEELQSDLHQEGAKYGYKGSQTVDIPALQAQWDRASKQYEDWANATPERQDLVHAGKMPGAVHSQDASKLIDDPTGRELYRTAREIRQRIVDAEIGKSKSPPRAPLENWEEPFIRYALKQGADEGFDVVTFPKWNTLHDALKNEGTQKFYDGRLPRHLESVAKSLGLKVEQVELPMAVGFAGSFKAAPRGNKFAIVNDKLGEWYFSAGEFDNLKDAQQAARQLNKKTQAVPAIRLTPEAKQRLSEGIIMDAKDPGRRAPAKRPPPAQAGFLQFTSDASSGIGDALVDAYGNLKRGMFANDPRQLNEVAEALKGMSPSSRALVDFNARRDIPQSVIAAADTPPELAELIGRATSQNPGGPDKLIDAQAKQYQTRLADQIMGEQRAERDLINMDKKAGPIGALEKEILSSYNWTPAREVQQDVALADLIAEGMKPGGGIPQNAGALDRFRDGISRGAQQPPMMMSPRDEDMLAKLIFDPAMAKNANDLLANPVKPWVSEAERKAIQIGVPATGLAAMIAGGYSLYNQPGGQADVEQPVPGSSPERPVYTVSDRLMPTNNPAEPPPELNGLNTDTRTRAQQRLMALGYAPMKLPSGARFDDGIDGPMLRRSVEAFQRENGLPPTGDLDPMTLRALWGGKNYGISPTMRAYGEELAPAPQ